MGFSFLSLTCNPTLIFLAFYSSAHAWKRKKKNREKKKRGAGSAFLVRIVATGVRVNCKWVYNFFGISKILYCHTCIIKNEKCESEKAVTIKFKLYSDIIWSVKQYTNMWNLFIIWNLYHYICKLILLFLLIDTANF